MGQDLQLFGDKTVAVPAHIQQAFTETNIIERDRLPSLTFKGKVFAITENNETTNLMKVDEEGDRVPIPSISVVVLEYAKARGRNYHEGSYDPDNTSAPKCWSTNSITPDDNVPEPENDKCATCPKAAKGSRTNDAGKPTVACAAHRLLAVVPIKRLDISPLRLKIPVTSDYDGQSPDLQAQGKFAFSNYLEFIKARGVLHTASMVTKVAFDPNQAYPKLLFSAQRWLTEPELAAVQEARKGGGVEAILGISGETTAKLPKPETAAAGGTTQAQVDAAAAQRAAQEKAAKEQAEKEAAEKAAKEKAEKAAAKKAAKEAAEKEAAEKAAAAAAASKPSSTGNGTVSASAGDFSDDDDEGGAPVTTAKADTAAPKKEVVEAKDSGIGDILNEWGADD